MNKSFINNPWKQIMYMSFWGVLILLKFWLFSSELTKTWEFSCHRMPGCARFAEIWSELTKTWSSGATEFWVWIGNCNVKVWKSTEDKLHNIWRSVKFEQNEHTPEFEWTNSTKTGVFTQFQQKENTPVIVSVLFLKIYCAVHLHETLSTYFTSKYF